MSVESGAQRLNEQLILEQKRKITDKVRIRFARFGDDVLSVVLNYALQPKRLIFLLQRLELKTLSYSFESQLDAVATYVSQQGPLKFLQVAHPQRGKDLDLFGLTPNGIQLDPDNAAQSPVAMIVSDTYNGPDRRSGMDRRQRSSRRADVQSVSKNKRFGGDRRKRSRGRRKTD